MENWSDLEYILKLESTVSTKELNVGSERKR